MREGVIMNIPSFPKIFAIGQRYTERLLLNEVEVTEKVDGSMIAFGNIGGQLYIRSKGAELYADNPEKMFREGIEVIKDRFDKGLLPLGIVFYGEYLKTERHNIIRYGRIPKNHIALFGCYSVANLGMYYAYPVIQDFAERLDLDVVDLIYQGKITSIDEIKSNLSRISALGKEKIEGIVIKNYAENLMLGGQVIPILMGKYVSEDFKEIHKKEWKKENTGKGKFEVYKEQFKTNARWVKAVHYLRDAGQLEYSPRDIGKLIKRIQQDITEEEQENIKDWLFKEFGREILQTAIKGFPEWYKQRLMEELKFNVEVVNAEDYLPI